MQIFFQLFLFFMDKKTKKILRYQVDNKLSHKRTANEIGVSSKTLYNLYNRKKANISTQLMIDRFISSKNL
jgi:DNA-binding XRE family transcriptional regulator